MLEWQYGYDGVGSCSVPLSLPPLLSTWCSCVSSYHCTAVNFLHKVPGGFFKNILMTNYSYIFYSIAPRIPPGRVVSHEFLKAHISKVLSVVVDVVVVIDVAVL